MGQSDYSGLEGRQESAEGTRDSGPSLQYTETVTGSKLKSVPFIGVIHATSLPR